MPFQKGRKKTGGRPKGGLNKVQQGMRDMIEDAFIQAGGVKYLLRQSKENPVAFMTLVGKILPREVKLEAGKSLEQLLAASYEQVEDAVVVEPKELEDA